MSDRRSSFQTTNWSMVLRARENHAELERLLHAYRQPVFAWLRCRGCTHEQADELTQGFFADVLLERRLLDKVDPGRGSFRAYVQSALRNFRVDERRRSTGRRGGRPRLMTSSEERLAAAPAANGDVEREFNRHWAATITERALAVVRRECEAEGRHGHWEAFEACVVRPALTGGEPPAMVDVARSVGAAGAQQASSMVNTVKRKLRRAVWRELAETVASERDLEDEIAALGGYVAV